jgi:hypothetical protein
MGLHMNWLAVEAGDRAAVLARLGLAEAGWGSEEFLAEYACATLPGGWLVLVSRDWKLDLDAILPEVSADGLALGCEASERVMFSSARAWRDGAELWAVRHDSEKGVENLQVEGAPPAGFADIRARLVARQEDEDGDVDFIYEAPLRLAESLCGYFPLETVALEWTLLSRSGARGEAPVDRSRSLAAAIGAELLPPLAALGWRPPAERPLGRIVHDLERVVDGRHQALDFDWQHDADEISFRTRFAVFASPAAEAEVLVQGAVARPQPPRPSLWRRLIGGRRPQAEPAPTPEQRLAAVVADAREDLLVADAFLSRGEEHPFIHVRIDRRTS